MKKKVFLIFYLFLNLVSAQVSIDLALAKKYFQEAETISLEDDGKLWGVTLAGPMLFADPKTRSVVANRADAEGQLTLADGLYVGTLPEDLNIADTATQWAGVKWTMVRWPLPTNPFDRAQLMAHELWHRIQEEIGFPSTSPSNHHLDTPEGRIWLQLEWNALREALVGKKIKRKNALRDALIFRTCRHSLFPQAAREEQALEMHEGLAAYTGLRLSGRSGTEILKNADYLLTKASENETYIRSFAYATGPAYGVLLDETGKNWRTGLTKEDDLTKLIMQPYELTLPADFNEAAEKSSSRYGGARIKEKENEREKKRQERIAVYRKQFISGPILIIPLRNSTIQFNPGNLQPLDTLGTVYPTIRVTDNWGILNVTGGGLMHPSWTQITVSAPTDPFARPLGGEGWTLDLNEGWTLIPGERRDDFRLKSSDKN